MKPPIWPPVCPHCGNRSLATIYDNGCTGSNLTYLCVKPCAASETADTDPIVPEDGIYVCGMQWDAVDQEEDEC